jgi:hypothetical protein
VQLQAVIEITPEYPVRSPLFKLTFLSTKESQEPLPQQVKEKSDAAALELAPIALFDNNIKVFYVFGDRLTKLEYGN